MSNITSIHAAAGRSPNCPNTKPRGKASTSYPTKAVFSRTVQMMRAAGIEPRSASFHPDGSFTLSETAFAPPQPVDEFEQWESRR